MNLKKIDCCILVAMCILLSSCSNSETFSSQPLNETYSSVSPGQVPADDKILNSKALESENTSGEDELNTHYIYNVEDFLSIRDDCLNENGNGNYILMNDIDLSECSSSWQPIGSANARGFKGNFDGMGHTISGFNVSNFDDKNTNNEGKTWGLFGFINGATIENLNLITDINIPSYKSSYNKVRIGAIVGLGQGTIKNCTVSGNISVNVKFPSNSQSFLDVGGIAGSEWSGWDLEVIDCKNYADMDVTSNSSWDISVCGIVGRGSANHCYNSGNIACHFPNGPMCKILGITYKDAVDSCNAADFIEFTGHGYMGILGRVAPNPTNCVANKDMLVGGETVIDGINDGVGMPKEQLEDWYNNQ